ncbi:MAG: hypothetical protein OEZ02_08635, partial [Anaerolineae bacterium]|nr:hypothetical protein [Anaerolineae bacterium]
MPAQLAFIPGTIPDQPEPLARFLPRLPQGVAAAWLSTAIPPGSWVIDPFGASPRLAIETAQAGYRILVAANNPITRFLLEMAAAPPSVAEFQAALAELASSRRGSERLEPHIRSLYATRCDNCRREVIAEAFLWQRGAPGPHARIYACSHCGHHGEFPATPEDIEKAASYSPGSLHRARALERIAAIDDPDRAHAEEALDAYPPRAVYALFTLINKLGGLGLAPERHRLLAALLISACDQANTLWPHPAPRPRPRQLHIPSIYRENNIWLALENAIPEWTSPTKPVP